MSDSPSSVAEITSAGMPVEIGKIDKELKKLWDADGGTKTRASLTNFAIFCRGARAMDENTALIAEFTKDHACRAILIAADADSKERRVQAWISAHCHVSRSGGKQVCCEQISFLIEGPSQQIVRNIVFSHLDSDLPLVLFWREDFPQVLDERLWAWVDRLIFDSRAWSDPQVQFARLRSSLSRIKCRLVMCDLNWTRLLHFRWALAQMFDHPDNAAELPNIEKVEITHAPDSRSTAILLLGWLAAQLKWKLHGKTVDGYQFGSEKGRIAVQLTAAEGAPVSSCKLGHDQFSFSATHKKDSIFMDTEVTLPDGRHFVHLVPAGKDDVSTLLDEELMRGGRHQVYLRALAACESIM
ncbi:MAG: glucose-6-phosphate dehydrogenase assembly protein OpcA [Chthoniobacteraceae bacterium]